MTRQFAPRLLRRFSHFGLNLAFGFEVVQCCVGFQARDFDFPIRQEIGILKVLGASSAYILNWLFQEALIIAIPGTMVGIAMTYGTKWLVMYVLSDFLMQETVYKSWPIAGAISAVGALMGAYLGARQSLRQDVIQALSYEESASLV